LAVVIPSAIAQVEVPNPDTLVEVTIGDTDTLDPVHAYDTASGEILFHIYDNLIAYKGPSLKEFVPMLATEWKVSPDGKTYTFTIRKGVKFHNGDVLTPDDVAYSFQRVLIHSHPDSPAWIYLEDLLGVYDLQELADAGKTDAEICEMVKNAVKVDGDKVIFQLVAPSATFLSRIAQPSSWGVITDKKWVIEQGGWDGSCETWRQFYQIEKENLPLHTKANGTGPFKLDRWTAEVETVLVRNDDYWGGPAKLARVIRMVNPEFGTRKLMLEKGDADIIAVPRQFTPQMEGTPGVRTLKYLPGVFNEAVFFNYDVPVEGNPNVGSGKLDGQGIPGDFFTDIHIRKAFNYCFDWKRFIDEVYLGEAKQSRGPIPSSLPYYNPDQPVYSYDLEKAAEEFKLAWGRPVVRLAADGETDVSPEGANDLHIALSGLTDITYWWTKDGERIGDAKDVLLAEIFNVGFNPSTRGQQGGFLWLKYKGVEDAAPAEANDLHIKLKVGAPIGVTYWWTKDGEPVGPKQKIKAIAIDLSLDLVESIWDTGFKFTSIYNVGNEMRRVAAEILEACAESLNPKFSVEVRGEPWPTYLDNFRKRRIPFWIIGWLADFPDPHNFVHPYMHSHGAFAYRQRLSKIANYDELIEAAAKEINPAKRQELYYELQKRAYEDAIDIFLDDAQGRHWQRCWVDGYLYNPMWPGLNYYLLAKKADGKPQLEAIQALYPEVQMDEWCSK